MEYHVPVVGGVGIVDLAISGAVKVAAIVHRIVWRREGVGGVEVNHATIAIIGVVQVSNAVVIVVPVNAVLESITVNIRIDVVRAVITIESTVDLVKVVVVVEVAIPIDIQNIDDTVVVVVNVVPVADTIAIPVVELRERGTTGLTAGVGANRVGVSLCWAVPRGDIGGSIKREGVVFILDVVVVKIVRSVRTAHGKVAEIVRGCGTAHIGIEPVIDAIVILVKRPKSVVVQVAIVIDFTIKLSIAVSVSAREVENS